MRLTKREDPAGDGGNRSIISDVIGPVERDACALALRQEQRQFLELGLMETEKLPRTLEASVFTDEAEAIAWLRR